MSYVIRGAGRVRWVAGIALGITLAFGATAQAAPQYTIDCESCHSMPPIDSGTLTKNPENGAVPGNHLLHAGNAASSCVVCHNQDASEVADYGTSHRNKNIELNTGLGYTRQVAGFMNQTSVPPDPLGTCATAACHSDGKGVFSVTPDWKQVAPFAAPGDCNKCHGVAPETGNHPTTGTKHAAYFGTGVGSCAKCHTAHDLEIKPFSHATSAGKRSIEVKFAGGGSFASNQCSNLYCHSNGQATPTYAPPTWGGTLTCVGCHGNATSDTLSGKHASHVNNGVLGSYGCVVCHSTTVSDNTTISNFSNHVNTTKDIFGVKVGAAVAGECATALCHQDGKGTQKTVTWTGAAIGCNGCHGSDAAADGAFTANFAAPNYLNAGIDQARANSHVKHVKSAGDCQNCHSSTTTTGLAVIGNHADGSTDVVQGNGKTFTRVDNTCSAISCHGNGKFTPADIKWGAAANCVNCHGNAAPALGGAHAAHLSISYYGCASCHGATVSSNTVISTAAKHMDSVLDVAGGEITSFDSGVDKSCTNSCHIGATAPKWNQPATGGCGTCHQISPSQLNNAHATHATAVNGPNFTDNATSCTNCHTYNGDRVAPHANGFVNLTSGFTVAAGCTGCHNQPINWTTGAIACDKCHTGALSVIGGVTAPAKDSAATSGHGKAGIVQGCVACHDSASAHINGGLAAGDNRLLVGLTGSDNAECNYCHTTAGTIAAEKLKSLNLKSHRAAGLGSKCSDCHDPHGTTNSMMVKTTIDSTTISFTGNSTFANAGRTGVCQACHMTTDFFTKAGQPVATHVDSTTNCLDCHQHNPATGLAFMANGGCDACHGYPPAPRETLVAVTFGLQNNWSSARFEDYSGGGGAHLVAGHIPKNAKAADGWIHCTPCHSGGNDTHARALPARNHVDNVSVLVDPQYRFSQDAFMSYTTAQLVNGGANVTGSCFNVSCHFKKTPQWSIER